MHYWDKRTVLVLAPDTTYPRHSEGAFIRLKDGNIFFAYSRFYSGGMTIRPVTWWPCALPMRAKRGVRRRCCCARRSMTRTM